MSQARLVLVDDGWLDNRVMSAVRNQHRLVDAVERNPRLAPVLRWIEGRVDLRGAAERVTAAAAALWFYTLRARAP